MEYLNITTKPLPKYLLFYSCDVTTDLIGKIGILFTPSGRTVVDIVGHCLLVMGSERSTSPSGVNSPISFLIGTNVISPCISPIIAIQSNPV